MLAISYELKSSEKRLDNYLVKIKVRGQKIRRSNFFHSDFLIKLHKYLYILLGFIFKVHLYVTWVINNLLSVKSSVSAVFGFFFDVFFMTPAC